jgi:hypothetical protein
MLKRYILALLFVCAAGVVSADLNDDALGIFNDFLGRLAEKYEDQRLNLTRNSGPASGRIFPAGYACQGV